MKADLETAMAACDSAELLAVLDRAGVPAAPILDVPGALDHPQARHRQSIWQYGNYAGVAPPVRLARTPARFRNPPLRRDQRERDDE